MKPAAKGEIILKYLRSYPSLPSLTLAKMIANELPAEFSIESARTRIRYYRGANGEQNRKHSLKRDDIAHDYKNPNYAPWSIDSQGKDYEPYRLPDSCRNIGIISDLHIPNHRMEPIRLAVAALKENKIDTLIINGDLLDNTPFTRFNVRRPSADDVRDWFDLAESIIEWLREQFPKARMLWTEGNHDNWYKRWMWQHAALLQDDPYFTMQERMHLKEYNVEFIPQEQYVLAGKLGITHGHHLVKGIIAPVNAARGVYLRAKRSVIIGHVHVESSHTETDMHGDIVTCWSTGCLCTLTPDYQPMGGKACHGFARVTVDDGGDFQVSNHRIYKGKIL